MERDCLQTENNKLGLETKQKTSQRNMKKTH